MGDIRNLALHYEYYLTILDGFHRLLRESERFLRTNWRGEIIMSF